MAKFNAPAESIRTTNKEGDAAYSMTDKAKLITQVLTSFFNEKKFYGDNSKEMQETIRRVIKSDPAFVANLAVYARRVFNMRSVAHVLIDHLAHEVEGKPFVKKAIKGVVLRGDDATEILSFYLNTFGKPIPNALRKGLEDVFCTFDEYTLAKYKGEGHTVKMRDILCLCRPKPANNEQSELWKRLLEGKLETPITWETQLSAKGNKKETWEALIDSGKVGYMATLRNLRNIISANPANVEKVYTFLEDHQAVRRSKQLPFRFLSAYKSVSDIASSRVLNCLESAVDASIDNLPRIPGTTVIAVDVSGSMSNKISANSEVFCSEIGMMLGLIANRICEDSIFYVFNNTITKINPSGRYGVLYACTKEARASGGTDMALPFEKMITDGINADRVIIISDNQCNENFWNKPVQAFANEYRRKSGNNIWVHAVDLQGYGTQQFHGEKTNVIAGWSEKVLDFIRLAEQGEGTLENTIENYVW